MPIDYAALAEQARRQGDQPVDYAALAEKARAGSVAPDLRPNEEAFQKPEGGAAGRAAGGFWDTTLGGLRKSIKTLYHIAKSATTGAPDLEAIEAAHDLVQSHLDQAHKAKEAWQKGEKTEAAGHAMAAALPVVGPAAAHAGERIGGEAPKLDRYGNVVEQGKAPDVAGGLGEAAGLIVSSSPKNIVSPAARFVGKGAGAVATAADRAGVPEALERSAGKSYRKMLTPSKELVPEAEKIAGGPSTKGPTGLVKDRPVAMTRKGMMQQAEAKMADVGPKTATVYADKPPLDPQPILDHLEQLRREKAIVKGTDVVSDPALNSAIDELVQNIDEMRGKNGKIAAATLDDFKDKLNRGHVSPRGHMRTLAPETAGAIERSLAGKIGSYLDTAYPDAAEVNAAYRTARGTKSFLEDQRKAQIAAESGVRTGSSAGFGAALKKVIPAPLRGVPNALSSLTDSIAWDSVSGATKAKIADLIRKGSWDSAVKEMEPLPKLRSVLPTSKTAGVIDRSTRVTRDAPAADAEWWSKQPPTRPEIQARYEELFNRAEDLSPQRDVRVPETGIPEGVARGMDARNNLAKRLLNKHWEDLSNSERNAIDGLVSEGNGSAEIPHYADGGVAGLHGPEVAMVGEEGPEAIVPLTAERGTVPEKPATLRAQLDQLAAGDRRVVMFPRGTPLLKRPKGMKAYQDEHGNTFMFDPAKTSQKEIDAAIQNNALPDLLGAADGGMGAPDKSALGGDPVAVVGRDRTGRTVQATASDKAHVRKAVRQTAKVTPRGGAVSVEPAEREISRRLDVPEPIERAGAHPASSIPWMNRRPGQWWQRGA